MKVTKEVLAHVEQERINQMSKHNEEQAMAEMFIVLVEEVGEVAQALQSGQTWAKLTDKHDLYRELIQVAAVACKMAERIKRNGETAQRF